jgi:hypothetical protein
MNTATYQIPNMTHFTAPSGEVSVWEDATVIIGRPKSTAIVEWQWNTTAFYVTYTGSTTRYYYYGIPLSVAVGLLATKSAGKFVNEHIKSKYEVAFTA